MNNAYITFKTCVNSINQLGCIHNRLQVDYPILTEEISDLLRTQLVNIVSAMDRFIHEIVCVGIIEIYQGKRNRTSKWENTKLSFSNVLKLIEYEKQHISIGNSPSPIEEIELISILNAEFKPVLKTLSFQQIDKIKDALSYIWEDDHKLQSIANSMTTVCGSTINQKQQYIKQQLQLIVNRRNTIVHEADWDVTNNCRYRISTSQVNEAIHFIEDFINAIYLNVKI